jgi:hypothetical protein
MECRAVAARWDGVTGELTVWDSTQATISVRGGLASLFDIDEDVFPLGVAVLADTARRYVTGEANGLPAGCH